MKFYVYLIDYDYDDEFLDNVFYILFYNFIVRYFKGMD